MSDRDPMPADAETRPGEVAEAGQDDAPESAQRWQLGQTHRKVDAMERMRGVTRYTDDLKLPGMLHCKIKRSPHPHAKILSIDPSRALEMDGVHAVITGRDLTIPYGIIPWTPDETALCVEKVCHVGDGVAAVAAVDGDVGVDRACPQASVSAWPRRPWCRASRFTVATAGPGRRRPRRRHPRTRPRRAPRCPS